LIGRLNRRRPVQPLKCRGKISDGTQFDEVFGPHNQAIPVALTKGCLIKLMAAEI
jgi:hypothetical protein